ncbi:MAG: glycoside hydrolase family 3 N-terminal domain-containing protein, partial [Clostridia bacterium]
MKKLFALLTVFAMLFTGCGGNNYDPELAREHNEENIEPEYRDDKTKAHKLQSEMSLEDKLWQLFYVTPEAVSGGDCVTSVDEDFSENSAIRGVGGVILFSENIYNETQVTKLLSDLSASFDIPVFLGVDEEGGKVSRLSAACGVTDNGNMSDITTAEEAGKVGERLGAELSALGFNMDFAPVADVLLNPRNKEIGKRSFGSDADSVAEKVSAEVKGI